MFSYRVCNLILKKLNTGISAARVQIFAKFEFKDYFCRNLKALIKCMLKDPRFWEFDFGVNKQHFKFCANHQEKV
jgi:hypothetical protein